jgi:hypothetical protein
MRKTKIKNNARALEAFVKSLVENKGARIVSFVYENEYAITRVRVLVGISVENFNRQDFENFTELKNHTTDQLELIVIDKIIESRLETLTLGVGNNSKYTCKGVYEKIGDGNSPVKMHIESGKLYLMGFVLSKKVLKKKKDYPVRNSKPETIIKNKLIAKYSRSAKFRQYAISLDTIHSVSYKGNKVVINHVDYSR